MVILDDLNSTQDPMGLRFRGYSSIGSYRLSLLNSTSLPLVIICADFILEVPGTL